MNNITLMGRMAKDPELKTTPSGLSVTSFTVAVSRGKDDTDWIPVVAWKQTAEFVCNYFRKGDMIGLVGRLQSRDYEKDGKRHTVIEVVGDRAYFCGGKTEKPKDEEWHESEEELPF